MGGRAWLRLRYHSDVPPDPVALQRCLAPLLRYGALILRWQYADGSISLWLEAPGAITADPRQPVAHGPAHRPIGVGDAAACVRLVPVYCCALRGAGTGGASDPVDFPAQLLPVPPMTADGELRLVMFDPGAPLLLLLGQPTVDRSGVAACALASRVPAPYSAYGSGCCDAIRGVRGGPPRTAGCRSFAGRPPLSLRPPDWIPIIAIRSRPRRRYLPLPAHTSHWGSAH